MKCTNQSAQIVNGGGTSGLNPGDMVLHIKLEELPVLLRWIALAQASASADDQQLLERVGQELNQSVPRAGLLFDEPDRFFSALRAVVGSLSASDQVVALSILGRPLEPEAGKSGGDTGSSDGGSVVITAP
jgi:hypothetical protein